MFKAENSYALGILADAGAYLREQYGQRTDEQARAAWQAYEILANAHDEILRSERDGIPGQ